MGFSLHSIYVFFVVFFIYSNDATHLNVTTKGLSEFSTHFYSQCVHMKPGNSIVSPFSVANALALLSQGTSGMTFEGLRNGLRLARNEESPAIRYREFLQAMHDENLSIHNMFYNNEIRKLSENFRSVIYPFNFHGPEKNIEDLNSVFETFTFGNIKDFIEAPADSDAPTALVNTVFFNGTWEKPFTKTGYTIHSGMYKYFMSVQDTFRYKTSKVLGANIYELNYSNSNKSMLIVSPQNANLNDLEAKLMTYDLLKIIQTMKTDPLELELPWKFKVEYKINLKSVLTNMGMGKMFTGSSDMNGFFESGDTFKVAEVVHKGVMEINEYGTVFAAGTGICDSGSQVSLLPAPTVIVENPFLFFIRDAETNSIIFSGRVEKNDAPKPSFS